MGGRVVPPLFVHENTIFTERMVVKSGRNFRSVGIAGIEPLLCIFASAAIYRWVTAVSTISPFKDHIVTEGQHFLGGNTQGFGVTS